MAIEDSLSKTTKILGLLIEISKLIGILALILLCLSALMLPEQTRRYLRTVGVEIQEIDLPGIKLVQAQTYDAAETLIEAKVSVDNATSGLTELGNITSDQRKSIESALSLARIKIAAAETSLDKQEKTINSRSKTPTLQLPETAWIFVALLNESGRMINLPESRVDLERVVLSKDKISKLFLKYDAPAVDNASDCTVIRVEDYQPPPPQTVHLLIRADPREELNVIGATSCPTAGKGKQLYAQIQVPVNRVRFAKSSEWR